MNYSITNPNHAQSNHDTHSTRNKKKRRHIYMFTEIISIFVAQVK